MKPGLYDIRLRRSDLRYFLLNPGDSQKATQWICSVLNLHPLQRLKFWKECYKHMTLQIFGCYMLSLSLITNTAYNKWAKWIEICDPNILVWITPESTIDMFEKIWNSFLQQL